MSILKKPYELSVWEDVWDSTNSVFKEQRVAIIGCDKMTSQSRAIEPKLKSNINGSNELTFKLYYIYEDHITGGKTSNPFVKLLANETKLKLCYDGVWFDLIIKDIVENSSDKSYSYTATDQHIIELSKNGYGVVLAAEASTVITEDETSTIVYGNSGTAGELAERVMAGVSGWTVESEKIPQLAPEALVKLTTGYAVEAWQLLDETSVAPEIGSNITIPEGSVIYAFYSCCQNQPYRFSFIYLGGEEIETDQDGFITNKNCQYFVDQASYSESATVVNGITYVVPSFVLGEEDSTNINVEFSTEYRGKRYVFSQVSTYNPVLDTYVYKYDVNGESYWGYETTDYVTPNLVNNLVTNTEFKSNSGWEGSCIYNMPTSGALEPTEVTEHKRLCGIVSNPDILSALEDNSYDVDTISKTYMGTRPSTSDGFGSDANITPVVVNSSFYDHRSQIKQLSAGEQYVCMLRLTDENFEDYEDLGDEETIVIEIAEYDYDSKYDCYTTQLGTYMTFGGDFSRWSLCQVTVPAADGEEIVPYYCSFGFVSTSLSAAAFKHSRIQAFIKFYRGERVSTKTYNIADLQIFPLVYDANSELGVVTPMSQSLEVQVVTKQHLYKEGDEVDWLTAEDYEDAYVDEDSLLPVLYEGAQKVKPVEAQQSNYFNIIQSICEEFECWADFVVEHDTDGTILSKTVYLKNYIDRDNFAGFRAGVNLKNISRTKSSKSFVSKLIVPANINEYADGGHCTIQRSKLNETGESYIYDFGYYVNQGLLSEKSLNDVLYGSTMFSSVEGENTISGYYPLLNYYNQQMAAAQVIRDENYVPLLRATQEVTSAKETLAAAEIEYADTLEIFETLAQCKYADLFHILGESAEREADVKANCERVKNSSKLSSMFVAIGELKTLIDNATISLETAEIRYAAYNAKDIEAKETFEQYQKKKAAINAEFFRCFSRFIQEGTWKDEAYLNNDLYFIDARAALSNSSLPQVSYSFDVMDVSVLPGLEGFEFKKGDKTFVEDEEFFGTKDGVPYREEVIISETVQNLDEPDKNTVTVQNYKNQFQDLFQKITATVQSVSYASAGYDRASNIATASTEEWVAVVAPALNAAKTIQNEADSSVVWGSSGIVITDPAVASNQVRISGNGIYMRDETCKQLQWKLAVTASGINASTITTGNLDTGSIQIMKNGEPYFRWDTNGITAFDIDTAATLFQVNYNKWVRFNKFGLFGVQGQSGMSWYPETLEEAKDGALFSLTWDGLDIKLLNGGYSNNNIKPETIDANKQYAIIGKVDDELYNIWSEGSPGVDSSVEDTPFARLISVGTVNDGVRNEGFAVYSDGTMVAKNGVFSGKIDAEEGMIGGITINEDGLSKFTSTSNLDYQVFFRAGVSYRTVSSTGDVLNEPVAVVRNWGSSTSWYNYVYDIRGLAAETKVTVGGLPAGTEFFLVKRIPNKADSVSSSDDTSKGISCYYHTTLTTNDIVTITPSEYNGGQVFLLINKKAAGVPTVEHAGKKIGFQLLSDGSFTAELGTVGGFTITQKSLYSGKKKYWSDNQQAWILDEGTSDQLLEFAEGLAGVHLSSNPERPGLATGYAYKALYESVDVVKFGEALLADGELSFDCRIRGDEPLWTGGPYAGNYLRKAVTIGNNGVVFSATADWEQEPATIASIEFLDNANQVRLAGNWLVTGTLTGESDNFVITSDQNAKNSISSFTEKHELLFDNLLPRIFKYNTGASDKYHSGFVAQEVLSAINASGLTTQDFAAYVEERSPGQYAGLRYSEFISLNTWQIQLLKQRVQQLEDVIVQLQGEIDLLKNGEI